MQRVTTGMFVNYFSSGGKDFSLEMAYYIGLATALNMTISVSVKTVCVMSMHWSSMRMRVALDAILFKKVNAIVDHDSMMALIETIT